MKFFVSRCSATSFLLAAFTCAIVGCGSDRPTVVPASGVVLFDGEPLNSGSILFQPVNGRHSRAAIQPDGTFVMTTFSESDGATVGPQSVRVSCTKPDYVDEFGEDVNGATLIPIAYANFRTSGIKVDIPPEGDDSIVIELTKKKKSK